MYTCILGGHATLIVPTTHDGVVDVAPYVNGGAIRLNIRVLPGAIVKSLMSSVPLTSPASQVVITNEGHIQGKNGIGSYMVSNGSYPWATAVPGERGRPAIDLQAHITLINNPSGTIWGGGGGGGGAGGISLNYADIWYVTGGGAEPVRPIQHIDVPGQENRPLVYYTDSTASDFGASEGGLFRIQNHVSDHTAGDCAPGTAGTAGNTLAPGIQGSNAPGVLGPIVTYGSLGSCQFFGTGGSAIRGAIEE